MTDSFGSDNFEPDDADITMPRAGRGQPDQTADEVGVWSARIRFENGLEHLITTTAVVGRDPSAAGGVDAIKIDDRSRSVSKDHAAVDHVGGSLMIRDLDTVNGTVIDRDGERLDVGSDGVALQVGDSIILGDMASFVIEAIDYDEFDDRTIVRPRQPAPTVEAPQPAPPDEAAPHIVPVPPGFDDQSPSSPAADVGDAARCGSCGDQLEPGAQFCTNCGTPVADTPPSPAFAGQPATAPPGPSGPATPPPAHPHADQTGDSSRSLKIGPRPVLLGLGGLIAALVIAVVLSRCGGGGGGGSTDYRYSTAKLANTADRKFDIKAAYVTGEFGKLNAIVDDEVIQYDENGDERWTQKLPSDFGSVLQPVDGLVPVLAISDDGDETRVVFFDEDSGDQTDTEIEIDLTDQSLLVAANHFYVTDDDNRRVELYDVKSGDPVEKVTGDFVFVDSAAGYVFASDNDGEEVSVYDLDLKSLATDIEIDPDVGFVGYVDGKIITVDDDEVIAYDSDGEAWTSRTKIDKLTMARPVGDGRWLITSGPEEEAAIVTNMGDDEVEEKWSDSRVQSAYPASDGRIILLQRDEYTMIDLDGNEVYEFRDQSPLTMTNGMLAQEGSGDDYRITAIDFDGNEKWTIRTGSLASPETTFNDGLFDPEEGDVYGPE